MGERAERLAREIGRDKLTGLARALADEAVLVVERLEHLDRTLQGDADAWLGINMRLPETVAEVVVNAPLAEARQQGMALKSLAAELAKLTSTEQAAPVIGTADQLTEKREKRRREAAGGGG